MLNQNRHYWTPPKWLSSSAVFPSDGSRPTIWRHFLWTSGGRSAMRNEPWLWPEVRDAGTSGAGAVPLRSAQLMGQQKNPHTLVYTFTDGTLGVTWYTQLYINQMHSTGWQDWVWDCLPIILTAPKQASGSHKPSSENESPFLEGGCCCATCMAADIPHITMQCTTAF